ncbi:MAG TPA: EAL domain-containing protein [Oscillatoriaceae cyanobacterium M33_DOE_052]|uniref:EAL domain-containing protein n=1 Tax=Planktothricoides sp. SpSt-374 TaxID=2282167 RepID=A0A7C3VH64_9CYAN|nr:EAL domain-containing protein [Oscillatoriaceae cyanobacterium M33_DOE_052]
MQKILVIEDETSVRENIIELLFAEEFEVICAENGRQGVRRATAEVPDLIICDVMMPELDGFGVLTELRQNPATSRIPFIFLTAKADRADWRQGMELGADDYLTKPFTREELLGAIAARYQKQLALQQERDRELQQLEQKYRHRLQTDSLTTLPTRLMLPSLLEQATAKITASEPIVPLICLGLDRFSRINDNLGNDFGDRLLVAVAQRLNASVRMGCATIRLDSDRFAIITPPSPSRTQAARTTETILTSLRLPFRLEDQEIFITASFGIALYPQDGRHIEQLIQNATKALNVVKVQGGDDYQFYLAARHGYSENDLALENQLRYALERQQLQLYYQPQYHLQTGEITGAEALLRWRLDDGSFIPPAKFIPLAETSGLIVPIGEWVLQTACQEAKIWQKAGFPNLRVAVNISARQLERPDWRSSLVKILTNEDFPPQLLELELTESILLRDTEAAIKALQALKALSVRIAIDDFGTGYSGLSYLQRFPFDKLKIDRSFILNLHQDSTKSNLTQAIIEMARYLHLKVVAEGVESAEEMAWLQERYCDEIQGYFFSHPLPLEQFLKFLDPRNRGSMNALG